MLLVQHIEALIFLILNYKFRTSSEVASRPQLCGVVITQDGVAQRGSEIAATLAPLNDDFGYVLEGLDHVFRFAHMHKSYWRGDDARRMRLTATNELAQFH